jgi:histidine triad (HIT) family protein
MAECLFCQIVRGDLPSKKVYEDDEAYAFEDRNPQAPTHVLIVPKKHIRGLPEAKVEDSQVIGHCYLVAADIARERNIQDSYRVVCNTGPRAEHHLHFHLLGGRDMGWPPG